MRRVISEMWFDFDGTLVDSAPGIVWALRTAFEAVGLDVPEFAASDVVGPPLKSLIERLAPNENPARQHRIQTAYRDSYDREGYRMCHVYDGWNEVLAALRTAGLRLRILTNKRQSAVDRMIRHFGWSEAFDGVHGAEEGIREAAARTKPERAKELNRALVPAGMVIVGDSLDDLESADGIGAPFILARWGYGARAVISLRPDVQSIENPGSLLGLLPA